MFTASPVLNASRTPRGDDAAPGRALRASRRRHDAVLPSSAHRRGGGARACHLAASASTRLRGDRQDDLPRRTPNRPAAQRRRAPGTPAAHRHRRRTSSRLPPALPLRQGLHPPLRRDARDVPRRRASPHGARRRPAGGTLQARQPAGYSSGLRGPHGRTGLAVAPQREPIVIPGSLRGYSNPNSRAAFEPGPREDADRPSEGAALLAACADGGEGLGGAGPDDLASASNPNSLLPGVEDPADVTERLRVDRRLSPVASARTTRATGAGARAGADELAADGDVDSPARPLAAGRPSRGNGPVNNPTWSQTA
jgi:hypothetical protein